MKVTNKNTGEHKEIKAPSFRVLQKALMDGVDKCVGSCKCVVEPDGHCPKGWPSRMKASHII